jgi:hypothetical protein
MLEAAKILEAIEDNTRNKNLLSLLATRGIVHEALRAAQSGLKCEQTLDTCITLLAAWNGQRGPQEAPLVGCIHLFAELRRSKDKQCSPCGACLCLEKASSRNPNCPYLCLLAALLQLSQGDTARAVFGHDCAVLPVESSNWAACLRTWDERLLGASEPSRHSEMKPPAETDVGQTCIMHVLELALKFYNGTETPKQRGALNLLLVPLLRAVYSQPDRAHLTYRRYWYGEETKIPSDPLHTLYWYDLEVLESFCSRGLARRSELLEALRRYSEGEEHAPKRKINYVLHGTPEQGDPEEPPTSPRPKMTRLSQLTCLVRDIGPGETIAHGTGNRTSARRYSAYLKDIDYRTLALNDCMATAPAELVWSTPDAIARQRKRFETCVNLAYEEGYDISVLGSLFRERDKPRIGLPVFGFRMAKSPSFGCWQQ